MTARRIGIALLALSPAVALAGCGSHGCQVCPDRSERITRPGHAWVAVDPPVRTLDNPEPGGTPHYVAVPLSPYGHGYVPTSTAP